MNRILFCLSVLSLFIFGNCKIKPDQSAEPPTPVGGECTYHETKGKATILEITKAPENGCPKPRMVVFKFEADDTPERHNHEILAIQDGKNPPMAWLSQHGISVGKVFECLRKQIQTGTCTPVLYQFKNINLYPGSPCGLEEGIMARLPLDISRQKGFYCWIKEAEVSMFAGAGKESEVWHVFSEGEVVEVLEGWQLNGTPWIKVKYTGLWKEGFDGQLDEAPPTETGWVTGDVDFLFGCR